jgi:energy-coupling factor transporter ATP-binding protein EcfA2
MDRLLSLSTRAVPGLPDTEIALHPMTALIGVSGSGKSRLLWALAWLVGGSPELAPAETEPPPEVRATIQSAAGPRTISRTVPPAAGDPPAGLPTLVYLPVRARLPVEPPRTAEATGDASIAEQLVADIAADVAAGTTGRLLVIDEPELMLTPQAQRHLYRLLRSLVEAGNQVVYATRAPALLDAVHHEEIVRLDMSRRRRLRVHHSPSAVLTDEQRVRLAAEFDHERTEMFFARAVVLVEGQTERLALPLVFRALGHDPDALGISIVEVGGKGNLVLIARVLAELRIPHLIVHDSDRGRPGWHENEQIRRQAGNAPVIQLDPDFEGVAGIRAHDDKVFHAWRRFHDTAPEGLPEALRRIVATATRLAGVEVG